MSADQPSLPRIFLSYGRADAGEIADALTADLTAAGFRVWRDALNLHSGVPWDEQIQHAVTHSNVLLSVLTPHAVRSSSLTNPVGDDSVCLDEIATARFSKPRIPILPVLALPCAPPFAIQRLHYLDFTRWRESQSAYATLLATLVEELRRLLSGQPERPRDLPLMPILFDTYLAEKQRHFVGREWLLDDLLQWLEADAATNVLFLVGPPGIGKSAVIAQLVRRNPRGVLSAFHFCRADVAETIDPIRVIEHLCAMLASQIADYERALAGLLRQDQQRRPSDPISFAERYLLEPLARSVDGNRTRQVIAVDGLDEGSEPQKTTDVVRLVAHLATKLPDWLRLILTSLRASDIIRRFSFVAPRTIDAGDERNRHDVAAFIRSQLGDANDQPSEQSRDALEAAAGGNFLIARTLSWLVQSHVIARATLSHYQPSLSFLYASLIERLHLSADQHGLEVAMLQQIATTRRPLPRKALYLCLTRHEPVALGRFNTAFDRLTMFLVQDSDGLRLFHQSFYDWLVNEPSAYQVDIIDGNRKWARFAVGCLQDAADDFAAAAAHDASVRYAAEYVLVHARLGGEYDTWRGVVMSLIERLAALYGRRATATMDALELRRIEDTAGLLSATTSTAAFTSGDFRSRLYDFLADASTLIHLMGAAVADAALRPVIVKALADYDPLFVPLMYLSQDWFSGDGLGLSGQVADVAGDAHSEWRRVAMEAEFQPS